MVEFSRATREARVRFPANASVKVFFCFFLHGKMVCSKICENEIKARQLVSTILPVKKLTLQDTNTTRTDNTVKYFIGSCRVPVSRIVNFFHRNTFL